jgi:hypothetical protein
MLQAANEAELPDHCPRDMGLAYGPVEQTRDPQARAQTSHVSKALLRRICAGPGTAGAVAAHRRRDADSGRAPQLLRIGRPEWPQACPETRRRTYPPRTRTAGGRTSGH